MRAQVTLTPSESKKLLAKAAAVAAGGLGGAEGSVTLVILLFSDLSFAGQLKRE
ncbi:MAG: hypothetical protein HY882_06475 [Deltaproteobacteria bacterium]|nr:hypothetical protein [Deltaproteobacteria bacterium]